MEGQEALEPEKDLSKDYELNLDGKTFKFTIEAKMNINKIKFELVLISEIAYYKYIRYYNYKDIIKDWNLSKNEYNSIKKVYYYIDIKN